MRTLVKVAHVMRRFALEKWGGTETVVLNLSRELERAGVESPVFCTDMFAAPGRDTIDGVRIERFPYVFPWLFLSEEAKAKLRLKGGSPVSIRLFGALLREPKVSIFHAHVQHRLGGMARQAARIRRVPYVVSIHGGYFTTPAEQIEQMRAPFQGRPEWGKLAGALLGARRVLRDADAILCVGRDEHAEVQRRYPRKRVCYVPNGVRAARFRDADPALFRAAFGLPPDAKYVLCVSRIDYQKNQLLLVRAFAGFAAAHPDYRLVLVGPVTVDEYGRRIRDEIEACGLAGNVLLVEGLPPDDPRLPSAFRGAAMFVLPTAHEPFGIVILEAWAAGAPVVATRVGGIPGFSQDGKNILWFENGDGAMLARRMAELADRPELARSLAAAAAREVAERYDWAVVAGRTREIYQEVIARRSAARSRGARR